MSDDIFSPAALAKSVHATLDEALAAIPPGKHRAVLIDASTDTRQVRAIYVEKISDTWTVALEGEYGGRQHVSGKVSVAGAW